MARTTPAQKPRGEHSSTFSGGFWAVPRAWDTVIMDLGRGRRSRHSTWPYALALSSDALGRNSRPNATSQRRVDRGSLRPAEPRLVARVQLRRLRRAVAMDHRRERAPDGVEAGGHVAVSLGIDREVARREQFVERLRRLGWVEPVALVDGRTLDDGPAAPSSLQPVEESRMGCHVGEHAGDLLAHQDDDIGLRQRAIARKAHHGGKNLMLGTLSGVEALPAAVDEFAIPSAEPGDGNLSLRHEGCEQLRPLALVAIKAPGLDQLGAGVFVIRVHLTLVPSWGFPQNHHSRMTTDGATSSPAPLGEKRRQRIVHGVIVD